MRAPGVSPSKYHAARDRYVRTGDTTDLRAMLSLVTLPDDPDRQDQWTDEERLDRQADIRERLTELDTRHAARYLPPAARREWEDLMDEYDVHARELAAAGERAAYLEDEKPCAACAETQAAHDQAAHRASTEEN
jgi:hypothetical protein